jgi:hypothetical protein
MDVYVVNVIKNEDVSWGTVAVCATEELALDLKHEYMMDDDVQGVEIVLLEIREESNCICRGT